MTTFKSIKALKPVQRKTRATKFLVQGDSNPVPLLTIWGAEQK